MTFSVNPVEFTWITVNTVTLFLTVTAYFDARADRVAVRLLNGKARELAATGIVRREGLRVAVQILLLGVALPGLFVDRQAALTPSVALLMVVPVLLLLASFLDARDRKYMTVLVTAEALDVKTQALDRIEKALQHNTEVSSEAVVEARRAYHEANDVNNKIASQGAALVLQGEERAAAAGQLKTTVDATASEVHDLHEGTAPEGAS